MENDETGGIPLKLLKSNLHYGQQCVKIEDQISSMCIVEYGVPQGIILGPFLFNLGIFK